MAEYIEREAILKHTTSVEVGAFSEWDVVKVEHIKNAPAADVVEVVRCRDCEKCVKKDNFMYCEEHSDGWGDYTAYVDPDDYCSYGERRSENEG